MIDFIDSNTTIDDQGFLLLKLLTIDAEIKIIKVLAQNRQR